VNFFFFSVLMNVDGDEPLHLKKNVSAHLFQYQNVLAAILKSVELWLPVFVEQGLAFGVFSEVNFEIFEAGFMSPQQRIPGQVSAGTASAYKLFTWISLCRLTCMHSGEEVLDVLNLAVLVDAFIWD
jgi:hypothetical protein